jgi:acetyl esterase/lipase
MVNVMHYQRSALVLLVAAALTVGFAGCTGMGGGGPKLDRPYLEVRRGHATVLTERRRAPEPMGEVAPPAGATEVAYRSGELDLKAWLALPAKGPPAPIPAIVYLHGGFGLDQDDFAKCKPFLDAGYAVLLPTLRGENNNRGDFELLYGEVDDARAAIQWLANDPRIDKGRLYAFGHSVGGGLAALLSLWDDVPLLASGSAGGLYPYTVFASWSDILPFDRRNPLERQLRLLLGNTADMKCRHYAYIGEEDDLKSVISPAEAEVKTTNAPLTIALVDGDHMTSLGPAMRRFIRDIERRK